MNFNISSRNFDPPILKDLLKTISTYFQYQNKQEDSQSDYYIIGATARDIIMTMIHKETSYRKTGDLDIAIAIADWTQYDRIMNDLCTKGFSKSKETQRLIYKEFYALDIIPFGGISKENNIYWPPNNDIAMSILGFSDIAQYTITVTIDNDFSINIASLAGIFMLKLVAWNDRHTISNKDADDMAYILLSYLDINIERAVESHYDIYEAIDFHPFSAAGVLMARDIMFITPKGSDALNYYISIVEQEVRKEGESILIGQILATHRTLKYEDIYSSLKKILQEWTR